MQDVSATSTNTTEPSAPPRAARPNPETAGPDLILVHPALAPRVVQRLLPEYWPEGDLVGIPAGYEEVSRAFPGLRAFLRTPLAPRLAETDPDLPARVRQWVDQQAQRWDFGGVLATKDLNFWAFLRDGMIPWLCRLASMRAQIMALPGDGGLVVLAAGIDRDQRRLLRLLADSMGPGTLRPEIAFVEAPADPASETVTGRRARKIFFLLQDAWHGMRFLLEDLLVRRPKVLLVSHDECWMRRRGLDGGRARTDVHLEAVWREGRKLPFRFYYLSGSYHPDVGAMTASRLPPAYWRHLLFLLAQKSRGALETRNIQRAWRRLRAQPELSEAFVHEGLDLTDLVLGWLDDAVEQKLPSYARDTRRESHFLRGVRPDVILLTHERDANRPLLVAAKRMGIPTAALQLGHVDWGRDASRNHPAGIPVSRCLPDRLCVFSPQSKAQLVEWGALDPAMIVTTGDPRLDAVAFGGSPDPEAVQRLRRQWGVEEGQRVIGVACRPEEHAQMFSWIGAALGQRKDAFLLVRLSSRGLGEEAAFRQSAAGHGLRWLHLLGAAQFAEAAEATDVLLTSCGGELAEGVLHRMSVIHMHLRGPVCDLRPDPGRLVFHAENAAALSSLLAEVHSGTLRGPVADETWRAYVRSVFGPPEGGAARRVIDTLMVLMQRE
jgi:hypothetical protein